MTLEWVSDCCDCILGIEKRGANWELIEWKEKCALHKNITDSDLVQEVLTHNNSFKTVFSSPPTDAEKAQNTSAKRTEQKRIRDLGASVKNTG